MWSGEPGAHRARHSRRRPTSIAAPRLQQWASAYRADRWAVGAQKLPRSPGSSTKYPVPVQMWQRRVSPGADVAGDGRRSLGRTANGRKARLGSRRRSKARRTPSAARRGPSIAALVKPPQQMRTMGALDTPSRSWRRPKSISVGSYCMGRAQSRCRCGRGEPSPGADVAGASQALASGARSSRTTGVRTIVPTASVAAGDGEQGLAPHIIYIDIYIYNIYNIYNLYNIFIYLPTASVAAGEGEPLGPRTTDGTADDGSLSRVSFVPNRPCSEYSCRQCRPQRPGMCADYHWST